MSPALASHHTRVAGDDRAPELLVVGHAAIVEPSISLRLFRTRNRGNAEAMFVLWKLVGLRWLATLFVLRQAWRMYQRHSRSPS